ncbi:MAG: hypothetical protein P8K80_03065 [Phycisphaerales bacterium]|nr:hypothetical protein [Phycisphaerales bacterium]
MSNAPVRSAIPKGDPRSKGPRGASKAGPAIDPVRVLRQHVLGVIVSGVVGIILGIIVYFVLRYTYPLYKGEVIFEIRPGLLDSTDIGTKESMSDKDVLRIANTQTLLLKQRDVLTEAVNNPSVRNTTWLQKWFIDPQTGVLLEAQAVDDLQEYVSAGDIRNTNLFNARWSWHTAQDVPIVLNAIASAYLRKIEALDNQQFSENEELFRGQLRRTRLTLQDLNDEIQGFIVSKGITTLDDPRYSQAAFETQKLTEALTASSSALTSVQTQYMQTAAKLEGTIEPTHDDIIEAEYDVTMQRQLQALEQLRASERSILEQFQPDTPQVRNIERTVRSTEQQLEAKRNEILRRNLNARVKTLGDERAQLADVIEGLEAELERNDVMLRDLAADSSYYDTLVTQRAHMEAQREHHLELLNSIMLMKMRADAGRVRLANLALTPRELSFPLPEIIIPAGVVLCVGLFVGFIFLKEMTNQRIRSAGDLAIISGAKILGSIPDVADDPTDIEDAECAAKNGPESVIAESYRQAWSTISRMMQRKGHASLLVASGLPGSGSTTAVSNLAIDAASSGLSVAVIDGNFRRPRLASILGLKDDAPGLGDVLCGKAAIDDVTMTSPVSGCTVISAGTPEHRIYSRFNDEAFDRFLASLRSTHSLVLIDTAPAVAAGDAFTLANRVDAIVMVVQANNEERGLVARLINQFSDMRGELMGILLNRPRMTAGGYFKKNYELMASYSYDDEDESEA